MLGYHPIITCLIRAVNAGTLTALTLAGGTSEGLLEHSASSARDYLGLYHVGKAGLMLGQRQEGAAKLVGGEIGERSIEGRTLFHPLRPVGVGEEGSDDALAGPAQS